MKLCRGLAQGHAPWIVSAQILKGTGMGRWCSTSLVFSSGLTQLVLGGGVWQCFRTHWEALEQGGHIAARTLSGQVASEMNEEPKTS